MDPAGLSVLLGLGNPGEEYAATRHNVGFMVVDELARRYRIPVRDRSRLALTGFGAVEGTPVLLVRPRTYMNRSGQAARSLRSLHGFPLERMLVVVDDFNLPLGRLRLRPRGSDGGHRGLASLIECLGTREFPRLRLGVGPLPPGPDPADFVLSPFGPGEREACAGMVARAADCAVCWLTQGVEAAMNRFNARVDPGGP